MWFRSFENFAKTPPPAQLRREYANTVIATTALSLGLIAFAASSYQELKDGKDLPELARDACVEWVAGEQTCAPVDTYVREAADTSLVLGGVTGSLLIVFAGSATLAAVNGKFTER